MGGPSPHRQQGVARRVLVVDDDPDILDALSEILEVEGYDVQRARNGREALQRLEQAMPDLVLLDLMMPVMDGWAFARSRARGARPPIIVLSADRNVSAQRGPCRDALTQRVAGRYGPPREGVDS